MRIIGLTGGISMGKSTLAQAFRRAGIWVFDADAEVHRLQAPGGAALAAIAIAFPGTVRGGVLDRAALRAAVIGNEATMQRLEAIMHRLVRAAERRFLARARRAGRPVVVLDIPLLFETGSVGPRRLRRRRADVVVVASAPATVQRARLRRRRISAGQAAALIARQMPDVAKRRRADVVIRTGLSRHHAQRQVRHLLHRLRNPR